MSFNIVPTVTSGDSWSAANHNLYIRDNFSDHESRIIAAEADILLLEQTGMKLISEQILASPALPITFSSIASTYRDLKLIINARSNGGAYETDSLLLTLNGDTGNNYAYQVLDVINTTVQGSNSYSQPSFYGGSYPTPNTAAGLSGISEIFFPNYASTNFKKSAIVDNCYRVGTGNGKYYMKKISAWWDSANAINQISITAQYAQNFAVGSTFSLYGIA
jgi:hypothetical protein